jgi:hypothetical protein
MLREMRGRRLAMYLGEVSILKLADFLRGFDYAIQKLGQDRDSLLQDFRNWVQKKFATPQSWEKAILVHSTNETDAVDNFWKLLDEFLLEAGSAQPGGKDESDCRPFNGSATSERPSLSARGGSDASLVP